LTGRVFDKPFIKIDCMSTQEKTYQPIDCDYYDRLEAWATTKTDCRILYKDETGAEQEISARIEDLYTADHVEYMRLDNGQELRLDTLVAVNDIPLPAQC
jgi:Rho-binding antiterminator